MKFTSILSIAAAFGVTSAAATPDQSALHEFCYTPGGPCIALDHAIVAARGLLGNPFSAPHDEHSMRASDYLESAINGAEKRDVSAIEKREPLAQRTNWCGWVGQACWRVKRSAETINDILGAPVVDKRCGETCAKARRSADALLAVSRDILASM